MVTPSGIRGTLAKLTRQGNDNGRKRPTATTPTANAGGAGTVAAKLGHLLETEVFAALPEAEQRWLADSTTMVSCERGRVFYRPDEPAEVVFILKRGHVDLYRLAPDGRKLIVARIEPHTIFGQMALIGQGMYGCYAEAAEACLLCVLSRADLEGLIGRNPAVGLRLLAMVGERLQEREAELEAFAFHDLPTRLAALLLREADAAGTVAGYSHQVLAERLGTYRETVSHLLGRFRAEGLVAVEPRRIRVLDRAGLEVYAEG